MSKPGIWFSLSFVAWLATTHPAMSDETAVSVYGLAPELYEQFSLTPNATASQVVLELQHSLEQAGYVLADVRLYADNKVGVTLGQVREIQINGLVSVRPLVRVAILSPSLNRARTVSINLITPFRWSMTYRELPHRWPLSAWKTQANIV